MGPGEVDVTRRAGSRMATALAVAACGLYSASCGYSVVQTHAPFGAHRIAVVPFAEAEAYGIAADLARELANELAAGGVDLVGSEDAADAVLTGEITTVRIDPAVTAGISNYRLTLVATMQLKCKQGTTWGTQVAVQEDYLPPMRTGRAFTLATEANRREGLGRAALAAARELRAQLVAAGAAAPSDIQQKR